jgi:hypothetical protein
MPDTDQHTGEALLPLFIDDGFAPFTAQFTESFDVGGDWPGGEIFQRMREIFELARAHPIGIGAAGNRCGEQAKIPGRALRNTAPGTDGQARLPSLSAVGGPLPADLDCAMGGVIACVDDVAAQGDVLISRVRTRRARTALAAPVAVVDAQFGGNPHTLHPDGQCFWDAEVGGSLKLGVLTVGRDARAFLFHREHGALQIAPGTYRLGRQREFIRSWQEVAD